MRRHPAWCEHRDLCDILHTHQGRLVEIRTANGDQAAVSVQLCQSTMAGLDPYAVTPQDVTLAVDAREWVRGRAPLPAQDRRVYLSEVPDYEWEPPKLSPGLRALLRRGEDAEQGKAS